MKFHRQNAAKAGGIGDFDSKIRKTYLSARIKRCFRLSLLGSAYVEVLRMPHYVLSLTN